MNLVNPVSPVHSLPSSQLETRNQKPETSPMLTLELDDDPAPEDFRTVLDGVRTFNRAQTGHDRPQPVAYFLRDEAGQIVPGSFQYNKNHTLFDRTHGISGILRDQQFYKWLHNVD